MEDDDDLDCSGFVIRWYPGRRSSPACLCLLQQRRRGEMMRARRAGQSGAADVLSTACLHDAYDPDGWLGCEDVHTVQQSGCLILNDWKAGVQQ